MIVHVGSVLLAYTGGKSRVESSGATVAAVFDELERRHPGLHFRLSAMRGMEAMGRLGTFPNGMNGIAVATTVCNQGTVEVPWFQAMNVAHPKIAFLIASVRNGRIEQLSDRSAVKHGFFAA